MPNCLHRAFEQQRRGPNPLKALQMKMAWLLQSRVHMHSDVLKSSQCLQALTESLSEDPALKICLAVEVQSARMVPRVPS